MIVNHSRLQKLLLVAFLIVILSNGFSVSVAQADSIEVLGVKSSDTLDMAVATLRDRHFNCNIEPPKERKDSPELSKVGAFLCTTNVEDFFSNGRFESDPAKLDTQLNILGDDILLPFLKRGGQFRIVSSKEVAALDWAGGIISSGGAEIDYVAGYSIDDVSWFYFSCSATTSCNRPALDVVQLLAKHTGSSSIDPRVFAPPLISQALILLDRSNLPDIVLKKAIFQGLSEHLKFEETISGCVVGSVSGAICPYSGELVLILGADGISSKLYSSNHRAMELGIEGLRIPLSFIVMSDGLGPSGAMSFE